MAQFNEPQATPRLGVRGNAESLQPLKPQASIEAGGGTPNVVAALTDLAFTPTALGQLASQVQTSAATAIATKTGQTLGKEPKGNLLPPITNFDKTVSQSYATQAQTTLGLQAHKLMTDGNEEIAKANRITPELIETYKKNMAEGLQETINQAPDSIKPQMMSQFGNALINSTHELNNKLTSQNKSEASMKASLWRKNRNDAMQDAIKDGKYTLADSIYESLKSNIQGSKGAGTISISQADSAMTATKLNYESAKAIKKGMDYRSQGKLEAYLAAISDSRIGNLSWHESETIRNNTVHYFNQVEAADNRYQQVLSSQAELEITQGQFNSDRQNFYKEEMRPAQFNHLMTRYNLAQRKANKEDLDVQAIIKDPGNAESYVGKGPKQINAAYDKIVASTMLQTDSTGNTISQEEAQFQAASLMNTIVPKYIDKVNRDLKNGNPNQILNGIEQYERLHALEGNKTIGVDDKALAMAEVFKDMLADNPGDVNSAAQAARDIVFNKDESIFKLNNMKIQSYLKQNASDPRSITSWAVKTSGLSIEGAITNQAQFNADVLSRFKGYMMMTNGNEEVSKTMTQKAMNKAWGTTYINGKAQTTYLPIEQTIGLSDKSSASLIQSDVIEQLKPQLEETRKAFDNGTSTFYWKVKDKPSFEEYAIAKEKIRNLGIFEPAFAGDRDIVERFESNDPIEIEQVFKNKTVIKLNLDIQTSSYARQSGKQGEILGGYNIGIRDPVTGIASAMHGFYGQSHTLPEYRPNMKWIRDRYNAVNGLQINSFEELRADKEKRMKEAEYYRAILSRGATLNQVGR